MSDFSIEQNALPKPEYKYITKEEDVGSAISEILRYPQAEFDTETTGFDPFTSKVVLAQIGVGGKSFVFDVRHDTDHSSVHLEHLKPVLANKQIKKLIQNSVFDMKMVKHHGGYYIENIYDTMLVEQLFNLGISAKGASLADLVRNYLGLEMTKEPATTFVDYKQVYQPYQLEYAASDVTVLELIKDLQEPRVTKEKFENVCRLEFEFTKAMCEMELNGITLDADKWRIIMRDIDLSRIDIFGKINSLISKSCGKNMLFGVPAINIDSNKQLLKALNNYGLALTDTGEKALSKFKGVPLIDHLLSYRKLNKLISTYGESLLDKINPITGRLHTRFRQMVSTGRMSSSNPNLQNIPKKQIYRSCFIARPGYSLVTADMSGAELRILGNLSNDAIFIDCYARGIDLHTRTASEVFDIPMDQIMSDKRGQAKAVNFGLCTSEDVELISNVGIKAIKDIEINNIVSHDVGCNRVIDKKYMGEKEVFELKTKYGYTIEVTEDHLIKVIDSHGDYVDKKLSDIVIDKEQVCLKLGADYFPNSNYLFNDFKIEHRTNHKEFILPEHVDNDLASFLGLFVAEGSVFKAKKRPTYSTVSFGFTKNDTQFIKKIEELFDKLFYTRYSKINTDKYMRYIINSVDFAEWLVSILGVRDVNKTNAIAVPDCIKQSNRESQVQFFKWLFEGDGTVKKNGKGYRIQYSSKSMTLVKDIQLMLLNFGIISSLTTEQRINYKDNYYVLSIVSAKSNEIFKNEIGFVTDRKNALCVSSVAYTTSTYFLNSNISLNERISSNNGMSKQLLSKIGLRQRSNFLIGDIYFKELSNYDDQIKFIYDNNILPLPIVSIKSKGIKRVYDISVEDHQYFLANGFIVHNCYGLTKYGLSDRLGITERAAEDMINKYFERYHGVKTYLDQSARNAIRNGFSDTVSGRKRFYNVPPYGHPDRKKRQRSIERAAKNAGIQGANADTIKESMIIIVDRLEKSGLDAKLLLTVHDEVIVESRDDCVEEVRSIVSQSLVDGFGKYFSKIPMETDALVGPCWLKGSCENKVDGKKCGGTKMKFVEDVKFGTKLVCAKCEHPQQ